MSTQKFETWAEVDLKAVEYNYQQIEKLTHRNKFIIAGRKKTKELFTCSMGTLTVIKADAYGHGMERIGVLLNKLGVNFFGVSNVEEALTLRALKITKPILLFESTLPECIEKIVKYDLTPMICTHQFAVKLDQVAKKADVLIKVHVEVDTGMGRLGVWPEPPACKFQFYSRCHHYGQHDRLQ